MIRYVVFEFRRCLRCLCFDYSISTINSRPARLRLNYSKLNERMSGNKEIQCQFITYRKQWLKIHFIYRGRLLAIFWVKFIFYFYLFTSPRSLKTLGRISSRHLYLNYWLVSLQNTRHKTKSLNLTFILLSDEMASLSSIS